jgi:carbonic anhydrase
MMKSVPRRTAGGGWANRMARGARVLASEWREMASPRHLQADLVAGATVACIALPLSLAIALASDVPPALGLVTAIVAGIVAAFFGGSRLAVAGPAAAMAVLIGQIVDAHGLGGLLIVGLGCGLLQLTSGVLGLGRFVRLVPVSVVHGFTAGIGVIILVGQLPRAIGLPSPDESHVFDVLKHVAYYASHASPVAAAIGAGAMLATMLAPKVHPRIPGALLAVAIPTALVWALGLEVPLLGAIPSSLPLPSFPALPAMGELPALASSVFVVFALASLESLLSASAVDKLAGGPPHDSDQELIGQGLANTASSLFGGIPVTSVIARSALNVQSGARTRRSAIIHALILVACVYALAPIVGRIPIAALGGVLLAVGARMLAPKVLMELWRTSRAEAAVFVVTAGVMVGFDLLVGVQAGCVAAIAVAAWRLSRARVEVHPGHDQMPHHVDLSGPFTFIAAPALDRVRDELAGLDPARGLVIDVRHLDSADVTAAEGIVEMAAAWRAREGRLGILGANAVVRQRLLAVGEHAGIEQYLAQQDHNLDQLLAREGSSGERAHLRLLRGIERFHGDIAPQLSPLLSTLADGQRPHTLLITCADSRISPHLITGSHPGELMIVRNLGALVAPDDGKGPCPEGATVEYAVRVLGVRNVVICAHGKCGALTALYEGKVPPELPTLERWSKTAHPLCGDLSSHAHVDDATRATVVRQLENLKSYEVVRSKMETGDLRVAAWFYDVEKAEMLEWNGDRFVPVGRARTETEAA